MPKERLHMLLADEALKLIESWDGLPPVSNEFQVPYHLGAVAPDMFFYDFPRFSLAHSGRRLHVLEGEPALAFFSRWLSEEDVPRDVQAWMFGVTAHFLTDGLWHPTIRKWSSASSGVCRATGLSPTECHLWLESELESQWISAIGPVGGYISRLSLFRERRDLIERYAGFFRKALVRLGEDRPPSMRRIESCAAFQLRSMEQFAHKNWQAKKETLLSSRATRFLGSIICPEKARLPLLLSGDEGDGSLCSVQFVARTVVTLAQRLSLLPAPF
jgi:hypothetical protein